MTRVVCDFLQDASSVRSRNRLRQSYAKNVPSISAYRHTNCTCTCQFSCIMRDSHIYRLITDLIYTCTCQFLTSNLINFEEKMSHKIHNGSLEMKRMSEVSEMVIQAV